MDGNLMRKRPECALAHGQCPPPSEFDCYAKDVCFRFKWTPEEQAAAIAGILNAYAVPPEDP